MSIQPQNAESMIRKGRDGWEATYTVPVEKYPNLFMRISTRKRSRGGIYTSLSCFVRDGYFETHKMYDDLHATLGIDAAARCTEKAVATQQALHVAKVWDYLSQATDFYDEKAADSKEAA